VFYAFMRWALHLLPARESVYTMDLDSTVMERLGEQEGVLPGYNLRRHGRPTHHPLLAGLAETKWILHGWLRLGYVASANNPHIHGRVFGPAGWSCNARDGAG